MLRTTTIVGARVSVARTSVGAVLLRNVWTGHAADGVQTRQAVPRVLPLLPLKVQMVNLQKKRWMSSGVGAGVDEQLNNLSRLFGDARLELEDCHDSVGTTYFEEDLDLCIELVDEVLDNYKTVLEDATESDAKNIRQSWGLKLEQLKGELQQLLELHDH